MRDSAKENIRLAETLRDAQALLQVSHALFGTIREGIEQEHDRQQTLKILDLTYYAQRIIDGYEDKIHRAL